MPRDEYMESRPQAARCRFVETIPPVSSGQRLDTNLDCLSLDLAPVGGQDRSDGVRPRLLELTLPDEEVHVTAGSRPYVS
jgi:hypothetical protein